MDWFGVEELGVVLLAAWLFAACSFLPNTIQGPFALPVVVIVGGAVILLGFDAVAPRPVAYMIFMSWMIALAAGVSALRAAVLFHRRNGYWRHSGRSAPGRDGPVS